MESKLAGNVGGAELAGSTGLSASRRPALEPGLWYPGALRLSLKDSSIHPTGGPLDGIPGTAA